MHLWGVFTADSLMITKRDGIWKLAKFYLILNMKVKMLLSSLRLK